METLNTIRHTIVRIYNSAMGVTKMGNIVPKAGLYPTSLAFRASILPLHHVGSVMSPLHPRPPVYAAPCSRRSAQTTTIVILDLLAS